MERGRRGTLTRRGIEKGRKVGTLELIGGGKCGIAKFFVVRNGQIEILRCLK